MIFSMSAIFYNCVEVYLGLLEEWREEIYFKNMRRNIKKHIEIKESYLISSKSFLNGIFSDLEAFFRFRQKSLIIYKKSRSLLN